MLKRLRWFLAGALTGALGAVYVLFRLRESRQRYTDPEAVIDTMGSAMRNAGTALRDAWDESRDAISEVEADLRDDYFTRHPRAGDN